MITYRLAVDCDVTHLVPRLRPSDVEEVAAVVGEDRIEWAVRASFMRAQWAAAALLGGEVIALFGINGNHDVGVPWFVGSPAVEAHPLQLHRSAMSTIKIGLQRYATLQNYVYADNHSSITWLRRLGFTLDPAAPFGLQGKLFHRFYMNRHVP